MLYSVLGDTPPPCATLMRYDTSWDGRSAEAPRNATAATASAVASSGEFTSDAGGEGLRTRSSMVGLFHSPDSNAKDVVMAVPDVGLADSVPPMGGTCTYTSGAREDDAERPATSSDALY